MAPRKRRHRNQATTLPADLLLEIVARLDPATLVRCAAACKALRRYILHPSFIRHVAQQGGIIGPRVLAYLHTRPMRNRSRNLGPLASLVHPATPAASRFVDGNLAPYLLRRAIGGLVLLRRRRDIKRSEHGSDLCIYNPMDGDCVYLTDPPGHGPNWWLYHTYVLLTAADGIGSSFQLWATNASLYDQHGGCRITLQMATPSEAKGASWGAPVSYSHRRLPYGTFQENRDAVVLEGGVIHWLFSCAKRILTYDIRTSRMGKLKLPPTNCADERQRILGRSPHGRFQLVTAERFMVSMWLHLSDGWVREAMIDTEQKLRSMHPNISLDGMRIWFERSGDRSGVVLLSAYRDHRRRRLGQLIVLDLETKEMRKQDWHPSVLFEVDLSARLSSMKIFS